MNQKEINETYNAKILLVVIYAGKTITYKQAAIQIEEIIKWRKMKEDGEKR